MSEEPVSLRSLMEQGFAGIHRELAGMRELGTARHNQNVGNFEDVKKDLAEFRDDMRVVETEVRRINGSVGRHDSLLSRHGEQLRSLFKRWGNRVEDHEDRSLEVRRITLRDARIFAALIGFGGAAVWFVVRVLLGWGPK